MKKQPSKHFTLHKSPFIRHAAIWLLLVGCATLLFTHYSKYASSTLPISICQIDIPKGSSSRLLLPDSTLIYLNGGSVLKYDANLQSQKERSVYLIGEGYFEVAAQPDKPFIVHTGEIDVKVTGTIFNVSSYPEQEDIKVSLLEGKVQVYSPSMPHNRQTLSPNEQAIYHKFNKQLQTTSIDVQTQISWITGRLFFLNKPLPQIFQIIAKEYNVEIIIHSQQAESELFTGSIDTTLTLDEILSYLDVDHKFIYKRNKQTIIITDKP